MRQSFHMKTQTLRAEVTDEKQLKQALQYNGFQYICAPERLLTSSTPDKDRIIAVPPVFLADCEQYMTKRLKDLHEMGFEHALAHTVDHILLIKSAGMTLHGGQRLNITNSVSADFFASQGFEDIILSTELTAKRINSLKTTIPKGITAYGRLPLMINRRCPINDGKPCNNGKQCGKTLTDRRGKTIVPICSNTVELLNPDTLNIADKLSDFPTADFFLLKFTIEKDIIAVTDGFRSGKTPTGDFTRGLYYRGVE